MTSISKSSTPATDFCRNFGRYQDEAIEKGTVEVSSNGRPVGAYLSQKEYEHYLTLKRRETHVYHIDNLPSDLLDDIEQSRYGVIAE